MAARNEYIVGLLFAALAAFLAVTESSFSGLPYRYYAGFDLFIADKYIRRHLPAGSTGVISNRLSIFESGFQTTWLIGALERHVELSPDKKSLSFVMENRGPAALHYSLNASFLDRRTTRLDNRTPRPTFTIAPQGFLPAGVRQVFDVHFPCTLHSPLESLLELTFRIGADLDTKLRMHRTCHALPGTASDVQNNVAESITTAAPLDFEQDRCRPTACVPRPSDCPEPEECKQLCRVPRKNNGDRGRRLCRSGTVLTGRLLHIRHRRKGHCSSALFFAASQSRSWSLGGSKAYVGFNGINMFKVQIPQRFSRCACLGTLKPGAMYLISGRWNPFRSRLSVGRSTLLIRHRRKHEKYLKSLTCDG